MYIKKKQKCTLRSNKNVHKEKTDKNVHKEGTKMYIKRKQKCT